jgi:transcriptional regulator with XRE-family HTH domain
MDYYALSDGRVSQLLGERLRALRLRKNRTQEELAATTALSLSTIKALETGKGKLANLIAVLRELDALDSLDAFIPAPGISPMELAKRQGRERRRATGAGKPKKRATKGDEESW